MYNNEQFSEENMPFIDIDRLLKKIKREDYRRETMRNPADALSRGIKLLYFIAKLG